MKKELELKDEEILLLGLCRSSFTPELKVMLRALAENIKDWNHFILMSSEHGVAALVYHNLERLDFLQYLPEGEKNFLKNCLLKSLTRNTRNVKVMAEALHLLNVKNMKVVLLKGFALEMMVYGNEGLRQMTDLDVLLTRQDCLDARMLLMENGFRSFPVKSVFHKPIMGYIGKHLPTLVKNDLRLELHHELFGRDNSSLTELLYERSCETDINGEKAFLPPKNIFFLYLVRHLCMHEMNNESQLRLYSDLVFLTEKFRDEIFTIDLIEYAGQAGLSEMLAVKLEPLRDLWGLTFPEWINEFIDKYYDPASINDFVFFLKSPKNNPSKNKGKFYYNTFREIPGIHRKILYILGDLFPTPSFMKRRYKSKSSLGTIPYYVLRWGKLWYLIKH
jgi:hypothetical protein